MPNDHDIGIVSALQRRTAATIARHPHLADKLLGKRPTPIACKTHRITVDLRKPDERTVETDLGPASKPPPAQPLPRPRPVTVFRSDGVRAILLAVAKAWNVGVPAMLNSGRVQALVRPRFAAMRMMRDRLGLSSPMTGRLLGKRDHTTCLSGLRRADWLIETDRDFRDRYIAAENELKGTTP